VNKRLCIGLDIGSTLTKIVIQNDSEPSGSEFQLDTARNSNVFGFSDAEELICWLTDTLRNKDGGYSIGVTGTGAPLFMKVAQRYPDLAVATLDGDAVQCELRLQMAGARGLARRQGSALPEDFLLVGIGTGTSYTFVEGENIRPYHIGNPMGGGTLLGFGGGMMDSDNADLFERHGDIHMKDRLPELAGSPFGELVLSSGGNLPNKAEALDWVTNAKNVVTDIAIDILKFGDMEKWQVKGPLVFVGTPVDEYPVFHHWLKKVFSQLHALTGREYRILEDASFAGAYGAYLLATGELKA
jgi:hypothetical protein